MTSVTGQDLLAMLPARMAATVILGAIIDVKGMEFDAVKAAIEDVRNQLHVETATWALNKWEADYKLKTPANYTYQERREPIVAKMRTPGKASIEQIKKVCAAYTKGLVEVTVNPDATVTIQFVDIRGVPGNLDNLKAEIRNVAPAHLELFFMYLYTLVGDLISWGTTVGNLVAAGVTVGSLKTWEPV